MTNLVKYDAMCRAIDVCHRVDEAKEIRNQAAALREYARQAGDTKSERKLAAIKVRAERMVGKLSAAIEQAKRGPKPKTQENQSDELSRGAELNYSKSQVLRDAGVTKQQAAQFERLAKVPEDHFEAALNGAEMPSAAGILAATAPPEPAPISKPAMRVWDWTRVFEKEGYLGRDPNTLLSTMTPDMLDDMHRLAPQIAAWFGRIGKINEKTH